MNGVSVTSVSYLGPEGFGNLHDGLQAWPDGLQEGFQEGRLDSLHWSLISKSDPGRFGRMDLLSRVGLMAVELLGHSWQALPERERDLTAVLVETASGCLAADVQFLNTPRASLFSYTLPSTVLGEICIRHHLRGPQGCQVASTLGAVQLNMAMHHGILSEALFLLESGEAGACLCVTCDAVDASTAAALGSPLLSQWHGGALLIGRGMGVELPAQCNTLSVCRKLVMANQ